MKRHEILSFLTGFIFFERWHPEVALRYLPIVSEIQKTCGNPKVLEVGSGGLGIVPYYKKRVTGIDEKFTPPYHSKLKRIKARATSLPFDDSSFDVSICVDMLEHMDKESRKIAIDEIIRVAKIKSIIALPCGKNAQMEDKHLVNCHKDNKKAYYFLKEHLNHVYPEKTEIVENISNSAEKIGKKIRIIVKDNENLKLRRFLMQGYFTDSLLNEIFFRKILLFFLPVLTRLNKAPTYRKIFIVDII